MSRFLSLAVLILVYVSVCQACRPDWIPHGGYCYRYKHEQFTFFEAKVTCDLLSSTLAIIQSDDDNNFLTEVIRNNSGSYTWIALEDLDVEGQFVWYPSQSPPEYTSWLPSDPNDYRHNEDCVTTRNDGQWQDWDCQTKHNLICQTENDGDLVG